MKKLFCTLLVAAFCITAGFAQQKQTVRLSSEAAGMKLKSVTQTQFGIENAIDKLMLKNVANSNGDFSILEIEGATAPNNPGKASLPVFSKLIEVPAGAEIEVLINSYREEIVALNDYGINVIQPTQPTLPKNTPEGEVKFVMDDEYYRTNRFDDEPLVKTEISGIMRGTRFGRIEIRPYRYNPVENTLIVYNDLDFTVKFNHTDLAKTEKQKSIYSTGAFDGLFRKLLNYRKPNSSKDNLSNYSKPLKYVIVANRMFEETLQPFVEWKTQMGYNVIEAYTDEVGTTNTAIKSYLQGLYDSATPEDPAPLYLLIVGDHSGTGAIPAFQRYKHVSDLYFVTFDGSSDFLPDMYFGRMSVNSVTELQNILNKTIPYERYEFPDDGFLDKAMLISGADRDWAPINGDAAISYAVRNYYNEEHGYSNIFAYYYSHNGRYNVIHTSSSTAAANDINSKLATGVGFANYTAHCSPDGWSSPNINKFHIPNWNNANQYTFMIGNCCESFRLEREDSFGENVLYAQDKGAVAYIGGTDLTYWYEDLYWGMGTYTLALTAGNAGNHNYSNTGFGAYDAIWHEHNEPFEQWAVTTGQIVMSGNLEVNSSTSTMKQYYWEIYNVSGDPSLAPYNAIPDELTVTYIDPIVSDTELAITTEPYTYIAISQNGTLLGTAWSGDQNTATLNFNAISESSPVTIVATKQNRKPYISTFVPVPPVAPTAAFTVSATSIIQGDTVRFTNESLYATTCLWDFGDGHTSTENQPFHQYVTDGTFTASLTVTNSLGSDSTTQEITVALNTNPPAVDFKADTTRFDAGFTVQFTDLSRNFPESYEWTFDGGTPSSSTEPNPAIQYSTPGVYSVALMATNQYGTDTITKTGYITVNVPPIIMSDGSTVACGTTFMDPGGDKNYPNKQDIVHTIYPSMSDAMVKVSFQMIDIESSNSGTSCYDYLEIYNGESIDAELIGQFCGQNHTAIGENGVIIANNEAGALTFRFVSDSSTPRAGWIADVSCYVHNAPPVAGFEIVNSAVCGGIVNFVNQSLYANAFEWNFGDGHTSAEANPTHRYAQTGSYTVTLKTVNNNGVSEAENTVTVESAKDGMNVSCAVTDATGDNVADGAVTLTVTGGQSPYLIEWTGYPDKNDSNTLTGLLSGIYQVVVTDANSCYVTVQITVKVAASIQREELQFAVIPNPAKDIVTVKFDNKKVLKIELFNMAGKQLLSTVPVDNETVLNLSEYPAGIYFVNLTCHNEVKAVKIQIVK